MQISINLKGKYCVAFGFAILVPVSLHLMDVFSLYDARQGVEWWRLFLSFAFYGFAGYSLARLYEEGVAVLPMAIISIIALPTSNMYVCDVIPIVAISLIVSFVINTVYMLE